MKKYFSRLAIVLTLALALGLAFAAPALAEPTLPSAPQPLAPENQFLGITKEINTPEGTVIPASTFSFKFEQMMLVSVDGQSTLVPREEAPGVVVPDAVSIPAQDITFPADQVGPDANIAQLGEGGHPTFQRGLDLGAIAWPHAGTFIFKISEVADTNLGIKAEDNRFMSYSDDAFVLFVTVGNFEGGLDIANIQVAALNPKYIPGEDGQSGHYEEGVYVWDESAKLENYQPGVWVSGTEATEGTWEINLSDIRFVNDYVHIIVRDLSDPALAISKSVVGTYADQTLKFDFRASLTIPTLALSEFSGPVVATVTNAAGEAVDPGRTITFAADSENPSVLFAEFTLAHGEQLRFPTLPAGTTYSVTEAAAQNYAATAVITIGGAAGTTLGNATATGVNTELTASGHVSNARLQDAEAPFNLAAFTNTNHTPEIMGLVVGSMPFVIALFAATVLLAMMVATRSRQRIEQLPIAYQKSLGVNLLFFKDTSFA